MTLLRKDARKELEEEALAVVGDLLAELRLIREVLETIAAQIPIMSNPKGLRHPLSMSKVE